MVLRGERQRKIKSPSASEQGWLCERVRMSSVVNRHPAAWGNRWREWKSPFWSPPYPWHPLSSIPPSHLSLCIPFPVRFSILIYVSLSLSALFPEHPSPLAQHGIFQMQLLLPAPHPVPSAPLTISPVVSGSPAEAELSLRNTQTHTHGFDLWSRLSSPPTNQQFLLCYSTTQISTWWYITRHGRLNISQLC